MLPEGTEEHAVLVLAHLVGLGFATSEARHVAAVVLRNELPPIVPPEMDALGARRRERERERERERDEREMRERVCVCVCV